MSHDVNVAGNVITITLGDDSPIAQELASATPEHRTAVEQHVTQQLWSSVRGMEKFDFPLASLMVATATANQAEPLRWSDSAGNNS